MQPESFIPVHTTADAYNRITLPKHFSDRISWLTGTDVQAWLLLLASGRYRLLSDEQVQSDPQLEPVRILIVEGTPAIAAEPSHWQNLKDAAVVARLVPISLTHSKQRWRISFPRELKALAPPDCDGKAFSALLSLDGYFEIWYTDVLRRAAIPLQNEE
jgi:hypothetical protein